MSQKNGVGEKGSKKPDIEDTKNRPIINCMNCGKLLNHTIIDGKHVWECVCGLKMECEFIPDNKREI